VLNLENTVKIRDRTIESIFKSFKAIKIFTREDSIDVSMLKKRNLELSKELSESNEHNTLLSKALHSIEENRESSSLQKIILFLKKIWRNE